MPDATIPNIDFFKNIAKRERERTGYTPPIKLKGAHDHTEDRVALRQKDFSGFVDVTGEDGKVQRRKMTPKQRLMAEYLLKGYNKHQAMLRAGYTKRTADTAISPKNLRTVLTFVDTMEDKLKRLGLTEVYMAKKLIEWMEAKKTVSARVTNKKADVDTDDFIDVPDYDTQLKAYDRVEKIFNPVNKQKESGVKKKEITFTEWISGGPEEPEEPKDITND